MGPGTVERFVKRKLAPSFQRFLLSFRGEGGVTFTKWEFSPEKE